MLTRLMTLLAQVACPTNPTSRLPWRELGRLISAESQELYRGHTNRLPRWEAALAGLSSCSEGPALIAAYVAISEWECRDPGDVAQERQLSRVMHTSLTIKSLRRRGGWQAAWRCRAEQR